eukprot:1764712-Rhodomonas_salina.1
MSKSVGLALSGQPGMACIIGLIKWVMMRPELVPMFADVGVAVDKAGNTDYSLLEFNQAVVAL